MVRSPPSPFTLPPLGPTPSESLVPVTMVSPWCRAWTRCFVILSWVSKQQQVHVKTVTGVLGPAGFVVLEQHGRLPATPYHPLLYLHPPTPPVLLSMYIRTLATMSTYHVFSCVMSELVVLYTLSVTLLSVTLYYLLHYCLSYCYLSHSLPLRIYYDADACV